MSKLRVGFGILSGLLWIAGCRAGEGDPKPLRNLVLVVIDTLRQDRVGAYGFNRPITPTLDRLASAGARADGLAPSSWTRPSMATLFSGLHPLRHQVAIKTDRFPDSVRTLPMRLRDAGFSTLGVTTNGHVAAAWGFDRGFDELAPTWRIGLGRDTPAPDVNRAVFERLGRLRPPFLLFVHYLDPHQPYAPPLGWDGKPLPPDLKALVPLEGVGLLPLGEAVSPERMQQALELYDGEIRVVDEAIGQLLRELELRGLDRETLTVVLSDHGEEFGEHEGIGHGRTLYEEVVRVPLILHAPGIVPAGTVVGRFPMESVLPTALDLLGLTPAVSERDFDGPSFAGALRGAAKEPALSPRLLYLEGSPEAGLALLDGAWKLVLQTVPYRRQLFDLGADPSERRDVAVQEGSRERLRNLAEALPARYNDLIRRAHERRSTTADEELSQQLAALGYGGANQPQFSKRTFPRRLVPADLRPGGPRGWEDIAGFRSCAETRDDPAYQLLEGWWGRAESEAGQWTMPRASFAVAKLAVEGEWKLELEGVSWRPRRCRVTLATADGDRAIFDIEPGPYRIAMPITRPVGGDFLLVSLEAEPPFHPRDEGLPDSRVLGIYVTRYCLSPAAP